MSASPPADYQPPIARVSVPVPQDLKEKLQNEAASKGLKLATYVRLVLSDKIKSTTLHGVDSIG